MRYISLFSLIVVFCSSQIGCSPGLGSTMPVPHIELGTGTVRPFVDRNLRLKVGEFIDSRKDVTLASIDNRELLPDGNVSTAVQQAFEGLLIDSEIRIALFDAPVLEGEVQDWDVTVIPSFPTTSIISKAKISVVIRNATLDVVYKAVYSGNASREHPAPSESTVKDVLSEAMAGAIREALRDQDLRAKIVENQVR